MIDIVARSTGTLCNYLYDWIVIMILLSIISDIKPSFEVMSGEELDGNKR